MKQIIHIFGASGSGTSTLGRWICEKTGYRFMDTDDYFWLPTDPKFTVKRPREERIKLMLADMDSSENAVISGALCGWGDELIPYFTFAVRLTTDEDIRIERLKKRERERFGSRIDEGGDMYAQHREFLAWARKYDSAGLEMRSKAEHDAWQKQLPCPLICLDGAEGLEQNYNKIKELL